MLGKCTGWTSPHFDDLDQAKHSKKIEIVIARHIDPSLPPPPSPHELERIMKMNDE